MTAGPAGPRRPSPSPGSVPAGAPRDVSISLLGFDDQPAPVNGPREVRLCLLGFGSVARALCELLAAQERVLA